MKELYNRYKREIWVGVVVSLITAAIIKLGDWFITVVPTTGITFFDTVSNILYSLAATYSDNLVLMILLMSGFGAIIGMSLKFIAHDLKMYRRALRLEKNTKNFSEEQLNEITKKVTAEMQTEKSIEVDKDETIPELIEKGKKIGRSAISVVLVIAFLYLFIIFFITTPMNLSNRFKQDIVKITPYVEEQEINQLESYWACMRSKAEYDAIYEYIDKMKTENDLP